ncbi:Rieske (2Fe-2S) protein [Streptomyces sp. NPDC051940]|uniref:Rieske (2Fe-2S) protein n=1 Tax=Streptomyces sp. NPDC051940 TaxID=3155675 RepID=UPI003420C13F
MNGSLENGRSAPRRTVVAAAGAVGLTAALAACGSDDSGSGDTGGTPDATQSTGGEPLQEATEDSGEEAGELAKTSDIPEGGGKIFKDDKVVVTQPAKGEFKAFSAVCTHQGCIVATVSDGTINCACHGSKYSIEDGSVKNGPATRPLDPASVRTEGDELYLS